MIVNCGGDTDKLREELEKYFKEFLTPLPETTDDLPEHTAAFQRVLQYAMLQAQGAEQSEIDGGNILAALFQVDQSQAIFLLKQQGITRLDVLNFISINW